MLKVIVLSLGLFVGGLFAQDNLNKLSSSNLKGYSSTLSINKEKNSPLYISVYDKAKMQVKMDVNLTLYTPNDKTIVFKHLKNINGYYLANVDFTEKGKYGYVLRFSKHIGGVNHSLRGKFKM